MGGRRKAQRAEDKKIAHEKQRYEIRKFNAILQVTLTYYLWPGLLRGGGMTQ